MKSDMTKPTFAQRQLLTAMYPDKRLAVWGGDVFVLGTIVSPGARRIRFNTFCACRLRGWLVQIARDWRRAIYHLSASGRRAGKEVGK